MNIDFVIGIIVYLLGIFTPYILREVLESLPKHRRKLLFSKYEPIAEDLVDVIDRIDFEKFLAELEELSEEDEEVTNEGE